VLTGRVSSRSEAFHHRSANQRRKRNAHLTNHATHCMFLITTALRGPPGRLRRVPSQGEIEALGNVKIALVPWARGGLSPTKAVEVVSLLEPEIVIPMHYFTRG